MAPFRCTLATTLVFALSATACVEPAPTLLEPESPAFVKPGGGGGTDTDSRAVWEFFRTYTAADGSTQSTGIHGDGRLADGSAIADATSDLTGAYQNDRCGVTGKIFWYDPDFSRSGDATIDPNGSNSGLCNGKARHFALYLDGQTATLSGPFTNARQVMQLALNEAELRDMWWTSSSIPECERLSYESSTEHGDNRIQVTRLEGDASGSRGVWMVESTGSHRARCYNWAKGGYRYSGSSYVLPFRIRITEVLHAG